MCIKRKNSINTFFAISAGCLLGLIYYYFFLKQIPTSSICKILLSVIISVLIGLGNAFSKQVRCTCVLILPMYCGKAGRGVLKAVILTYIITGPITNMGMNAREVVRVFACSSQLSYNLSREKSDLMLTSLRKSTLGIGEQFKNFKDAFRSLNEVIESLQTEIEGTIEIERIQDENDLIDDLFGHKRRSTDINRKPQSNLNTSFKDIQLFYQKKLQYRCENHLSRASAVCIKQFTNAYNNCCDLIPNYAESVMCWPLKQSYMCDVVSQMREFNWEKNACEPQLDQGLGIGYKSLLNVKRELVEKVNDISVQYKEKDEDYLDDQESQEIAECVQQAFEEKTIIMQHVLTIINICLAILCLRILNAAISYHDIYLTAIDYDNVYITNYFRRLDDRRMKKNTYYLLPLKKMERNKYIEVNSWSYKEWQRSNLLIQILKVMLEVVTATTFVMLDRLFYEALEVVRQHAEIEPQDYGTRDLNIEVEGTGFLAEILREFLASIVSKRSVKISNTACLPHPKQMAYVYFFKIYGGYLWIVILLLANPYTLRLKRLICGYFYPRREKERILHLYNDILKKRMKMNKTLRRKAVQSVRAHYLSGQTLLRVRMKFPQLLGWLRVLPAARMACLICGETEPRSDQSNTRATWYSCLVTRCPFVYCGECWREAGACCLACEPSLTEMSDLTSLTDDEHFKY